MAYWRDISLGISFFWGASRCEVSSACNTSTLLLRSSQTHTYWLPTKLGPVLISFLIGYGSFSFRLASISGSTWE